MKKIDIDIETTSSADLVKCGVYKYVESPDFDIILFGYSVDDGPVQVVDLARGERIPASILEAVKSDTVLKFAHNCAFERICLSRFLGLPTGQYLSPDSWRCTMVWASYLGYPQSLKDVGEALHLDKQKMDAGKDLIRYFCTGKHKPSDDLLKWQLFKRYNKRDVETEIEIQKKLSYIPVPDFVWKEFIANERINDRGVLVDLPFVRSAIRLDEECSRGLTEQLQKLTGLQNPNSVQQMKQWLNEHGAPMDSLSKKEVAAQISNVSPEIREVLKLRQQLAKSSVKKYTAMEKAACSDGRVRGMFRFYGAHTGRFTSKILNLQNLAQNHLDDLDAAKETVLTGDLQTVQKNYSNVPDTLSQLLRTAFIPKEGTTFIVADFAAIEARVIAWLAGEEWRQEVFEKGEDIYCASASQMFGVPVVKHGENGHLRQKGKIAELALGYSGSVGALKAMGALEMGLSENELQPLVDAWREANPKIVNLWYEMDEACQRVIRSRERYALRNIRFAYIGNIFCIRLPSGRCLTYPNADIGVNKFGSPSITYMGMDTAKKWSRVETFGGKIVENIIQAIARDILCEAMQRLTDMGYQIVMHIHDEVVIEAPESLSPETVCKAMSITLQWAEDLLLRADGYTCTSYRKD